MKPRLLLLTLFVCGPAVAQQAPSLEELRQSLLPYASAVDAITLPNGQKVNFTCMGEGSPTVILIPGLGDFAGISWGNIQPEMGRTTRVCAWDRPGWGLSDGAEGKHTLETSTVALEAALETGVIPGPYVLVGHSFGGYESLLYADRHPDQVAGMVMVDPSVPQQTAIMQRIGIISADPDSDPMIQAFRKCAADIHAGTIQVDGPDPDGCLTYPPFFPESLAKAFGNKAINPVQYETMASFLVNSPEGSSMVENPARNYGDMPLLVLTATVYPPRAPDTPAEQRAAWEAFYAEWSGAHDQMAALSSRGVNMRVPGANHYIQRSKPQVVIDAVEAVIGETRGAQN